MKHEQLVDQYRVSDINKRLVMFLYYRDLRPKFTPIENEGAVDDAKPLQSRLWFNKVVHFLTRTTAKIHGLIENRISQLP
jgi:hypothetical protein